MTIAARKITAFTKTIAALADLPNLGSTALLKQWFDSSPEELRIALDGLIDDLSSTTAGSSGAEQIGSAPIAGLNGATPYAQLTDLLSQVLTKNNTSAYMPTSDNHPATKKYVDVTTAGVILGQIPDGSLTLAKMSPDMQKIEREIANLKAQSTVANRVDGASGIFYDLNDGLNGGSSGKIDITKTNSTGTIPISAGTIVVPVSSTTGFTVGQEVTIFDDVNLERRNITALVAGTSLSFATMTNSYKAKAMICRSSVIQDTVNHLLKFNGWSYIVNSTNTGVNVVSSAYDTSGNGGDKLVKTANGWLIAIEVNGTTIQVQKSPDNGTTWAALCNITGMQVGAAIAWNGGNSVTVICNTTTVVYSVTFDVTTVTNIDLNSTKVAIDTQTSIVNNMTIKTGSDGMPQASWSSKNATYPNSNNVRYSKATTTAVTAWATPTQIRTNNTAGSDSTNPSIVVRSNNNPVITLQFADTTTPIYQILAYYYNGTSWNGASPCTLGYVQSNPCARVAPSGRIWCSWHGTDSTDNLANNVRYSYSDDGGVTWLTAVKLTSGNTYNQLIPALSIDKNNNLYILWHGDDVAGLGWHNIFRNVWTGTAFQGAIKLTTNTTASAQNPSAIDNNTLDFNLLTPPMIYTDSQAVAVKFSGTYSATTTTQVLVEDVRYNINPPANVSSAVAWVDHDADPNYSIAGAVSFQTSGGNESFASMTKTTAAIDGTHNEDQLVGSGTAAAKATLRLTLTRNSTSLVKNIESIMGAVGV